MSPIGRVVIVLNLIAAGVFAGFAGTNLQRQHHYKDLYSKEQKARSDDKQAWETERSQLEGDRAKFENAKTASETALGAANVALAQSQDENKRLAQLNSAFEGDIKKLTSLAEAANIESKNAFTQAKAAYDASIAAGTTRDEAVRAKDAAEAENRTLKTALATEQDTVKGRDATIADMQKEKSRLDLLVSVASQKGFLPSMAAPTLAGMVTNASANLVTIQVTDNPGKIDIAEEIARNPFRFAIYDGSMYKGEAVATKYEASANAILCNLMLVKGEIKEGDKAATKTP
jgi:hypothetical protein